MRFLKKDINKSLLVMIIFFLVLFTGFTVYYEYALRDIINNKIVNEEKLGEITARLTSAQVNNSARIKQIALIDRIVLEQKYNELVEQNENLKRERDTLQGEINLLKSEVEYQKAKLDGPVAQFRLIQDKNEQIKNLNDKINVLCLVMKNYNITGKDCG